MSATTEEIVFHGDYTLCYNPDLESAREMAAAPQGWTSRRVSSAFIPKRSADRSPRPRGQGLSFGGHLVPRVDHSSLFRFPGVETRTVPVRNFDGDRVVAASSREGGPRTLDEARAAMTRWPEFARRP
jgi:hypothetical protein